MVPELMHPGAALDLTSARSGIPARRRAGTQIFELNAARLHGPLNGLPRRRAERRRWQPCLKGVLPEGAVPGVRVNVDAAREIGFDVGLEALGMNLAVEGSWP